MDLKLRRVDPASREILERLLQFELYDVGMEPGPDGIIDWGESLDTFFAGPSHVPLFLEVDGEVAGFTLVKLGRSPPGPDGRTPVRSNVVEEFYVTRPHRRKGIGTAAMDLIFKQFPGRWTITTWPDDQRVGFWRHVATMRASLSGKEFAPGEHRGYPGQYVWIIERHQPDAGND
jgi:predicted acetyltransferase